MINYIKKESILCFPDNSSLGGITGDELCHLSPSLQPHLNKSGDSGSLRFSSSWVDLIIRHSILEISHGDKVTANHVNRLLTVLLRPYVPWHLTLKITCWKNNDLMSLSVRMFTRPWLLRSIGQGCLWVIVHLGAEWKKWAEIDENSQPVEVLTQQSSHSPLWFWIIYHYGINRRAVKRLWNAVCID